MEVCCETLHLLTILDRPPIPSLLFSSRDPDPSISAAPYRVYNLGNHQPVELLEFIELLEKALGKAAIKKYLPMQKGDVVSTYADIDASQRDLGFKPATSLSEGLVKWVDWYLNYSTRCLN